MSATLYSAAACFVSGLVIILSRNWFARSMMDGLRGFAKDLSSESVRRFCSTGLLIFGLALMAIGVGILVASAV